MNIRSYVDNVNIYVKNINKYPTLRSDNPDITDIFDI